MKISCDYTTIKAGKRHNPSNPITAAFNSLKEGIQKSDHEWVDNPFESDVVFVFGSITRRKMDTERAKTIQRHRNEGRHIFSLDSAFFSTYIREAYDTSETFMFRIGYGDCVGGAKWFNEDSPSDRFEGFKTQYNFKEAPIVSEANGPILFLLQSERGWQYDEMIPYYEWAKNTVATIRSHTDKRIVLRAHPNTDRHPTEWIARNFENIQIERASRQRIGVIDSIRKSSCIVTHSSSAAIESYVEGKPTIAFDKRCVIYDDLDNDLSKINRLSDYNFTNRHQKLCDWAYTSWHIKEMKNPKLIERYVNRL